jgi:hypothetical protein
VAGRPTARLPHFRPSFPELICLGIRKCHAQIQRNDTHGVQGFRSTTRRNHRSRAGKKSNSSEVYPNRSNALLPLALSESRRRDLFRRRGNEELSEEQFQEEKLNAERRKFQDERIVRYFMSPHKKIGRRESIRHNNSFMTLIFQINLHHRID